MSPEIREAIESAAAVGGNGRHTYRAVVDVVRKPTSPTALRHRLIAFLQEVDESLSIRELLDDLREGLHFEERP
jgi:hypothetical protein